MPPLQKFIECLGAALCEHATAALARLVPFETALLEVARSLHKVTTTRLTPAELRAALRELVSSPEETVELSLAQLSVEDMFNIWDVIIHHVYQLSVPYVARVVDLESTLTDASGIEIQERVLDFRQPVLTGSGT